MGIDESSDAANPALGAECAGIVTRVGSRVSRFHPGDAVIAMTPSFEAVSLFASHAVVPSQLVWTKPEALSFEQAAAAELASAVPRRHNAFKIELVKRTIVDVLAELTSELSGSR